MYTGGIVSAVHIAGWGPVPKGTATKILRHQSGRSYNIY